MSTSTSHDTELDLGTIEHLDFEVPCDSWICRHTLNLPDHPAQWMTLKPCGHHSLLCDSALHRNLRFLRNPYTGRLCCTYCYARFDNYLSIHPVR